VGTETLIKGTTGVEVDIGVVVSVWVGVSDWVGVSVEVGVEDGNSRVAVKVGSCRVGNASTEAATWVNPATTVCAAAVLIASESCRVMVGIAQARTTIDNVIIVRESRLEYDMVPPKCILPSRMNMAGFVQKTGSFLAPSNLHLR